MRFRVLTATGAALPALALLIAAPALARTAPPQATSVLYVADSVNNGVFLFNAASLGSPMLGSITSGVSEPSSLAVDKSGNLYVANEGNRNVTEYAYGATSPSRTITLSGAGVPEALAVTPGGQLVVGYGGVAGQNGTLAFFDKGKSKPARTVSISLEGNTQLDFGALTVESGDVYASIMRSPSGPDQLLEFARGSSTGVDTSIAPGNGQAFDQRRDFYVGDGSEVNVYMPGKNSRKYAITDDVENAGQIAVEPNGTLFVPNGQYFVCSQLEERGYVTVYAYGSQYESYIVSSNSMQNPVAVAVYSSL